MLLATVCAGTTNAAPHSKRFSKMSSYFGSCVRINKWWRWHVSAFIVHMHVESRVVTQVSKIVSICLCVCIKWSNPIHGKLLKQINKIQTQHLVTVHRIHWIPSQIHSKIISNPNRVHILPIPKNIYKHWVREFYSHQIFNWIFFCLQYAAPSSASPHRRRRWQNVSS